jgi:hypothetical protein
MQQRIVNVVFLAACLTFPGLAHAAATKISDPAKFVADVYAKYAKVKDYAPPTDIYSPRLAALFALDTKEAGGEVGRIDFDPWTNAQDFQISGVTVKAQPVENSSSREIVVAKFKNIGTPETIIFYFEKTGGEWKLDDMQSPKGEQVWTLSVILKYGWVEGK